MFFLSALQQSKSHKYYRTTLHFMQPNNKLYMFFISGLFCTAPTRYLVDLIIPCNLIHKHYIHNSSTIILHNNICMCAHTRTYGHREFNMHLFAYACTSWKDEFTTPTRYRIVHTPLRRVPVY